MLIRAMAMRCSAVRVPPSTLFKGMPTSSVAMMMAGSDSTTCVMFTRSRRWLTATWPQELPDTSLSNASTMLRPVLKAKVTTGSSSLSYTTASTMMPSMMM